MSGDRWVRLREMLDCVLDSPESREALLAEYQAQSPELCGELRRMLSEMDLDEEPAGVFENLSPDLSGQSVGPYRIVRELGRGGMGTVFLALREEADVQVAVALKFLRQDILGGASGNRFRRERRVLARLNHPNIARLLDWGTVSGGVMYLVMEYVDGTPITRECAHRRLGLAARLDLFLEVCAAVQHAHQNLVVHRDLKPSNILVTASGGVKLLDFGIAARLDSATVATMQAGGLTPGYASPEQIRGEPVTVASDVYSLGLLLYELLAGQSPYAKAGGPWSALQGDAGPPSRRATLKEIAAKEIAGDLDAIVLKALRREPELRYPSVEALSADIRRRREGRPVAARQGSRRYVAARFLRRNRVNVVLACCAVCELAAGATVAAWKWREAEKNLAVAERNYRTLRDFAREVIAGVDAKTATSATEAQRRMSDTAARYLDQLRKGRLDDEDLQAEIAGAYLHLGQAQGEFMNPNQGDAEAALSNFRNAYAIYLAQWRAHGDKGHGVLLLKACNDVVPILPDPASAVDFSQEAAGIGDQLRTRYPDDPDVLHESASLWGNRGQRLRSTGDLPAALASFHRAVETAGQALKLRADDSAALWARETFTSEAASTLRLEGALQQALEAHMEARRIAFQALQLRATPRNRRQAAFKLLAISETLRKLARYAEASSAAREAMEQLRAIAMEDAANEQAKADLSLAYFRLGDIAFDQGQISAARARHREALRLRKDLYERHPNNPQAGRNYLASLNRTGADFALAVQLGSRLIQTMPSDVYLAADLARAYRGQGTAESLAKCREIWRDVLRRCPRDVELAAEAAK
jgi:tetratricopeptide (TPR) repeat protein